MTKTYTIGQVARLSGLSTRRVRFYADEGLLPPTTRAANGYRVFSETDLVRLDLIRALRDAGAGFEMIRGVLAQRVSLRDVLRLRLAEVEALIASQLRVAATLRHALKSSEPTNHDLRRVSNMIDLSHAERRRTVRSFYDRVTDGLEVDPKWKLRMVEFSTPELPDEPTTEQIEAWIELSRLFDDPTFLETARAQAVDITAQREEGKKLDVDALMEAHASMARKAREAVDKGAAPDSEFGRALAQENLAGIARSRQVEPDEAFMARMRRSYLQHQPGMKRYWELLRVLHDFDDARTEHSRWLEEATRLYLQQAG